MKRLILLLTVLSSSLAAQTVDRTDTFMVNDTIDIITLDWTAAANGSLPDYTLSLTPSVGQDLSGYSIFRVQTAPGTPAPTDNYDVVMLDVNLEDILGSCALNRSSTTPESCAPSISYPLRAPLTVRLQNNSVNAAQGRIVFYLMSGASTSSSTVSINNFPSTQGVSVASLPLPAGAATEATLSALNAKIPSSPAQDRTTAPAPLAVRLSDGAAFYSASSSASPFGSANPASGLSVGMSDGANLQQPRLFDVDSGAGTQYVQGTNLRKLANGGSVEAGTAADPLRVDPTGTTIQPVSAASLPLPAGAATSAKQPALGTAGTPSADVISVQGVAGGVAQPISASALPLPTGAATETTLSALNTKIPASPATDRASAAAPFSFRMSNGAAFITPTTPSDTQPVSAASLPLPTGAATEATVSALNAKLAALNNSRAPVYVAPAAITGLYYGSSGNLTVQAAAHAATAGFVWLINPVGSARSCYVNSIRLDEASTTVLATPTAPRLTVERVTFTGTSSGAQIVTAKRASTDSTSTCLLVSASTGLTLTAGGTVSTFIIPSQLTAVGDTGMSTVLLEPHVAGDSRSLLVLAPGEGIVFRQADAGTTADTRKLSVNLNWQEQ